MGEKVVSLKTILDVPRFPKLNFCVGLLFSLPVSNAKAERKFSQLKLIKSDKKNRLEDGITISSLLRVNIGLKNDSTAH